MEIDQGASRISPMIDTQSEGRHHGDLRFKWSDNANPLGVVSIPVQSIKGADGPRVLITGGVHGDEFEGPAAILRLSETLRPADLTGQVILIPALNMPAVMASSRVNPLDGANLNRAFPGDPDGGPTAMIAHFVETALLPHLNAVIDLHAGGRASVFAPSVLATRTADPNLFERNLNLAEALGMPTIWVLSGLNDSRSLNAAAERAGVAMIAAELGGGGGVDPGLVARTETGLIACLQALGVLANQPETLRPARQVEVTNLEQTVAAPSRGLFDRAVTAGDDVRAGQVLGQVRFIDALDGGASPVIAPCDGFVLAHTNRGLVERGELLVQLTSVLEQNG
jgi:predicted deacylase